MKLALIVFPHKVQDPDTTQPDRSVFGSAHYDLEYDPQTATCRVAKGGESVVAHVAGAYWRELEQPRPAAKSKPK